MNDLLRGEYVNLTVSITLIWSDGNISSSARNWYLSTLPDDNALIFAVSLSISHYNFSSLILSSIFMINFYILSKRFFLNRE